MDFAEITPYLIAANIVQTWALGFYFHLTSKSKVITERLDTMEGDLKTDLSDHAQRLVRLEEHHNTAPTHKDIGKLHDKINRVAECSSRMEGTVNGMNTTVSQIMSSITRRGLS
jgi:hypothetical protein